MVCDHAGFQTQIAGWRHRQAVRLREGHFRMRAIATPDFQGGGWLGPWEGKAGSSCWALPRGVGHYRHGASTGLPRRPAAPPGLAGRALGPWFAYSGDFRQLMVNAMSAGYSWARPGPGYLNIYEYIRHK
jgi:hypothetical protein